VLPSGIMAMSATSEQTACGKPGMAPTWSSTAKDRVITALGPSRLWAALGDGILNEVYWPATGQPQTRDLGFIISGDGFWVDVKRQLSRAIGEPPSRPVA
jgi:glucoamylase